MRYWWVNQNQTYRQEITGGFLWSPKSRSDGGYNQFYDNMREAQPGDVIFSFCDTYIKAIGIVTAPAESTPKPDFGNAGTNWSDDGWLVPAEFIELPNPTRPKDHIDIIRPSLPEKYSPLTSTGNGLQSVYLAAVPDGLAATLISIIGPSYQKCLAKISAESTHTSVDYENNETLLPDRKFVGETTKEQYVKTRRGQDVFKIRLRTIEKGCRVTGVTNPRFLIASHIKPWNASNDEERIDGNNGLLLAPHIDHLFDKGLISFSDTGEILISNLLDREILAAWTIEIKNNVGAFNEKQCRHLKYHRELIFKQ